MNPDQWRSYLVTQQSQSADRSTEAIVEAAIDGGIDAVQLREKGMSLRQRYELGQRLRELTSEADVDLIVNDRIALAHAIGADGVHLGQDDLPPATARELLGPEAIVGVSVATVSEARLAAISGADYLGVGAVYGTDSKPEAEPAGDGIGIQQVADIAASVTIPVVAIGGITPENASGPIQAGASAVAVITAITQATDPEAATTALRDAVVGTEVTADD